MSNEKQQSSYKKLFSNTIIFAIGSFSSKILVLLLISIYTNYLTKSELGVTDVLTQIANWIIPIATMTITEAIIRFGLDKAYDKKKVFTIGNIICAIGLSIFAVLLFIVSTSGIADKYIGSYSLTLYLYVFMSSIKTLYTTFVRAMEKVKLFAVAGIVATFFTLFFTILFYVFMPNSFGGSGITKYLMATVLSDFITAGFVTFKAKLWKYFDFKNVDKEMMHTMLQYSVPLIPAQLLWLITNSSDTFMTTHYLGSEATGVLSAAYKIPNIVATVYMMFGQAWNMSAITEHDSDDRDKFYENVFDFNQSLLYILASGCMLIIQPLTNIMIGADFRECVRYSPLLIYSTIFSCFTTFMGSIYLATKETKRSLFTSLVSGVINVGLNIVLIPRIGLYGPAVSTVVSYFTVFIIRAYDSRKLVPFNLNIKKIIVNNIVILAMLAVTLYETKLLQHLILYSVLLLLFLVVFALNFKSISGLIYKFLPKKIADKIWSIDAKKLTALLLVVTIFIVFSYYVKFIPVYLVLAAAIAIGLKRNKKLLIYGSAALAAVVFGLTHSLLDIATVYIVLSIIPLIKYRKSRDIYISGFLFNFMLWHYHSIWLGIFVFLIEILVMLFIKRNAIRKKAYEIAYKKH